ncbi:High-affnity carbon uptake protein Hat/HatR [Synechocystis sp. PCC 6714]|nr:High-affnity carbon uptake protein Hat/HatR [Synechocystis sp. PCC 6714]
MGVEIVEAEVPKAASINQQSTIKLHLQKQFTGAEVALNRIYFSPDGKFLLTASADGVGTLWTKEGEMLKQLRGQKPPMFNARFSPDGQTLITTGYDGTIRLWNLQGELIEEQRPHRAAVADALFSPDGQTIVTCSDDGQTQVFTRQGEKLVGVLNPGTARNLAYHPRGILIASVSDSGSLYLINPQGGIEREIATGQGRINNVNFSPDGQQLLTAGTNGSAKLWNLAGELITEYKVVPTGWVNSAQFYPQGEWLATASDDGAIRLWGKDGQLLHELPLGSGRLTSLSFSPDGKYLAATGSQGQVWIFHLSK